jgi:hypothetical protein
MNIPENTSTNLVGFGILLGVVQCFMGYRIFKIILGLVGFLAGAFLAGSVAYGISQNEWITVIAGLLGGFLGSWLLVAIFFVGLFLIGALFGGMVGIVLMSPIHGRVEIVALIGLAVIGGVVAIVFQKFMIILATSFSGAWAIVAGVAYINGISEDLVSFNQLYERDSSRFFLLLVCWILLGFAGLFVQYRIDARSDRQG